MVWKAAYAVMMIAYGATCLFVLSDAHDAPRDHGACLDLIKPGMDWPEGC